MLQHQLDLTTVFFEPALLSRALVDIYDQEYQDTDIYMIVFRSQLKTSVDDSRLGDLDIPAHREAIEGCGFHRYFANF